MRTDSEIDRNLATVKAKALSVATDQPLLWKMGRIAVEGAKLWTGVKATREEAGIAEANAKRRLKAGLRVADLKVVQASLQETSLGRQTIYNRNNFRDHSLALESEYEDNLDRISNNFARNGVSVNSNASMMAIGRATEEFERKSSLAKRLYEEENFETLTQAKSEIDFLRQSAEMDKNNAKYEEKNTREAIRQTRNLDTLVKTLSAGSAMIDIYRDEEG